MLNNRVKGVVSLEIIATIQQQQLHICGWNMDGWVNDFSLIVP